ncbi:MAG TPA: LysM domain-containing protein, partial [Verrucomicrobiae bacterium]|nr:LysM domain-containing protein [Verrucomicrobiae bacterium]
MRWRALALVSLGVNVVLAAVWILLAPSHPVPPAAPVAGQSAQTGYNGSTNILLRRQFFSWQEVESPDYPTYISNLRSIGCPEQTIRDIIIADVNGLFARRRATELVTPEQQWWRSEPDTNVLQIALDKTRVLEDERRGLLTRLLGTNWESGDLVSLPRPSRPGLVLDGPILGNLPIEAKQALQEINARSQDRMQAYLDAQRLQGKEPDPVELARLRQQTRDDLARVLPPGQLEEFLLRYSQYANNLRSTFGELQFFNASADEFRAVFRATDNIDQQIQMLADSTDPASVQARKALETQRENAIKVALGPKRYEEYQMLHDPLYRDAVAAADQAGTPEAARTIYQINLAAASTLDALRTNGDLTSDQKAIEQKQLELDQLKANAIATGQQLPPDSQTTQPSATRRTYTLRPGDSLATIGLIYGVPESAIRAANPNVNFSRLRPGDAINLPRL